MYIYNLGKQYQNLFLIESLIFSYFYFLVVFQDEKKIYQLEFNKFHADSELL